MEFAQCGGAIMMPAIVEAHLREWYRHYDRHVHATAFTAQDLATAEHVSGRNVAKRVLVWLGDHLAMAVVAATDRVNLGHLAEVTGEHAELASEAEFASSFQPCAAGAEPPFAMFGVPIFADDKLLHEPRVLFPAGTHEDAVAVETVEWEWCERVQPITNLGRRAAAS
jgi:Ala-tRNA(Pro) deacylase